MNSLANQYSVKSDTYAASLSSWISYFIFPEMGILCLGLTMICTDLNHGVGIPICVCLENMLLVMIWVVKRIEIGCWSSGQPIPLLDNILVVRNR